MLGSRRGRTLVFLLGGLSVATALYLVISYSRRYAWYEVPLVSMEPTIPRGSRIKVEKLREVSGADLSYGDLVVFESPRNDANLFVQRIIGLPGDRIEVRAKAVSRNGQELDETYVRHDLLDTAIPLTDDVRPIDVPVGHAFLLGDNRDKVADSRVWGAIPFPAIKGRVIAIIKPDGS